MVLKLKEYTMASLGYKSSENPLISANQTRPFPFSSLKTHWTPPSHPKTFPPPTAFFVPLLPGDGRRPKARRRQPPPSSSSNHSSFLTSLPHVLLHLSTIPIQLGYQYLVYDNLGLCCIACRLTIYILSIPFLMCMNI